MLKTSRDAATGATTITFSLSADEGAVSVVGNFNDWTPGVHVLGGRGKTRSVSVEVPADYIAVFRYLGEGGRWFDEPEASYVDAGASVLLPAEVPVKAAAKASATKTAATKATATKATAVKAPAAKAPATTPASRPAAASRPASGPASPAPPRPTSKRPARRSTSTSTPGSSRAATSSACPSRSTPAARAPAST